MRPNRIDLDWVPLTTRQVWQLVIGQTVTVDIPPDQHVDNEGRAIENATTVRVMMRRKPWFRGKRWLR